MIIKVGKRKKAVTGEFSSYDELVRVLSEIDSVIFDEKTDLRKSVRAISNLLQIIENMNLRVWFAYYQQWYKEAREAEMKDAPPPPIPMELIQVGARIHKLITDRGKFILEVLRGKLDEAEEKKEEEAAMSDLLKLSPQDSFVYDDEEE